MTMIERVARAMFIAEVPGRTRAWPWEDADMKAIPEDCAYERANFERMARAAIEAMRGPSPKMLEEGFGALISGDDDALDTAVSDAAKCWRAMIDAALKEG